MRMYTGSGAAGELHTGARVQWEGGNRLGPWGTIRHPFAAGGLASCVQDTKLEKSCHHGRSKYQCQGLASMITNRLAGWGLEIAGNALRTVERPQNVGTLAAADGQASQRL